MRHSTLLPLAALIALACGDMTAPDDVARDAALNPQFAISDLKTVTFGGATLELWPFTGRSPSLFDAADPMNLLFVGENDPRALRAALMFVDGDRSSGPFAPFDCTWTDAIGDPQTAYTTGTGWLASAIQLQCGDYGPLRFHIRLWDAVAWTLGAVHLEVLIPGTTDHAILNWEMPELLVAYDLGRAGVLGAAPALSGPIFPSPFRTLNRSLYDALPVQLQALITGWPAVVPASGDVPLLTDEQATILNLAQAIAPERLVARQRLTLTFGQLVPRPFCAPVPVYVEGPVRLDQVVVMTPSGNFISHFHAIGHLNVTPIDPQTGAAGPTHRALVNQHVKGIMTDANTLVSTFMFFTELPKTLEGNGTLVTRLNVGPQGAVRFALEMQCH